MIEKNIASLLMNSRVYETPKLSHVNQPKTGLSFSINDSWGRPSSLSPNSRRRKTKYKGSHIVHLLKRKKNEVALMDASLSSAKWGMEEYSLIHQYNLSCDANHELSTQDLATLLQGGEGEGYNWFNGSTKHGIETRPTKLLKTSSSWESSTIINHVSPRHSNSSSSQFVSFEPHKDETEMHFVSETPKRTNKRPLAMTRTPTLAQDHVMAERKRREKLNERFIALSAMIPGLKKMDKASVLGDAVKYLKQLQERTKVFEEQSKKRRVESVVFHTKSQVSDDDTSSCDENFDGKCDDPEIEARVSDKDVLIRIHCQKQKGLVAKIISELESYNLSVEQSSSLPFGTCTLDITIVAKMDDDFSMTVKDLVKNLRSALLKLN